MKKQVINFRVTPEEKLTIEQNAKTRGMNVSDYLRDCVNRAQSTKVDVAHRKAPEAKVESKPQCKLGNAATCPAERRRTPAGVKVCVECGLK